MKSLRISQEYEQNLDDDEQIFLCLFTLNLAKTIRPRQTIQQGTTMMMMNITRYSFMAEIHDCFGINNHL